MAGDSRLRAIALTGVIAIVLLVLVTFLYLEIAGKDIASVSGPILGFATPTVTALLGFATLQGSLTKLSEKVSTTNEKLSSHDAFPSDTPKVGELNHDN